MKPVEELSTFEQAALRGLHDMGGGAFEISTDKQIAFWNDMDRRGFAKVSDHALCGFEIVRGTYVGLTEAGRTQLAGEPTPEPKEEA